jgi:hypothetical protein
MTELQPGDPCPICHVRMTTYGDDGISRDHILPRSWGGLFEMFGGVRNKRIMCRRCNVQLATCGHCIGALACLRSVALAQDVPPSRLIRKWCMGVVAAGIPSPGQPSNAKRGASAYPHADQRVAIARAIDRIGLGEFVFPAETAAARVWNLATLARRYQGPVAP